MSLRSFATAALFAVTLTTAVSSAWAQADPVVAKFKGGEVRLSEVKALHQSNAQLAQLPLEMVLPNIVDRLVGRKLVLVAAQKSGVDKSPDFQAELEVLRQDLMMNVYLSQQVDKKLTDEVLQKEYKKLVAQMPEQDEVHARHILLETEDEAKTVISILNKGGDFATLAEKRSTGPSAAKGGDLGYIRENGVVKPFADAAFAMRPGQVSQTPVKSDFGWHVIKVEDRRPVPPPPYESVKGQVAKQMSDAVVAEVLAGLQDKADVQRFNMDGTPVAE